jgi:hypothetical protein
MPGILSSRILGSLSDLEKRAMNQKIKELVWTITVHQENLNFPQDGKLPKAIYDRVLKRFPQYACANGGYMQLCQVPETDPRLAEFLNGLREEGAILPMDNSVMRTGVTMSRIRRDWQDNIDLASLLEMEHAGVMTAETDPLPDGMPYVIREPRLKTQRSHDFGHAYASQYILVRGEAKKTLESSGLKGLKLIPLEVKDKRFWENPQTVAWPDGVEPWFLMWSEIELPPVRNWLFDNAGRVFPSTGNRGPFTDGCLILEGHFTFVHMHYLKSEIDALGDFDMACTYERYSKAPWDGRRLLVSQRFRRVMKELGFKKLVYYAPCMVDAEPWSGGVDGPVHPRLSGPPPADPKPLCLTENEPTSQEKMPGN